MSDIELTYTKLEETYLDITSKYLNIDERNIEKALLQHTGVYAFFGAVLAHAKKVLDTASNGLESTEARVREERRAELLDDGKKATDRALDAYVRTVGLVKEKESQKINAAHKYHLAKNIMNSLDHQKDMLVQISANKRAEVKLVGDIG